MRPCEAIFPRSFPDDSVKERKFAFGIKIQLSSLRPQLNLYTYLHRKESAVYLLRNSRCLETLPRVLDISSQSKQ